MLDLFEFFRKRGDEDVANKPHRITIVLGLLSPMVALLALVSSAGSFWVASKALQVNERSMKVGQRAYVAIRKGSAYIDPPNASVGALIGVPAVAGVSFDFEIHNIGRTPASILSYTIRLLPMQGWRAQEREEGRFVPGAVPLKREIVRVNDGEQTEENLGEVPQDSFISSRRGSASYVLNAAAWRSYYDNNLAETKPVGRLMTVFRLVGELRYRDVFDDVHMTRWCWLFGERKENAGFYGYTTNCEATEIPY